MKNVFKAILRYITVDMGYLGLPLKKVKDDKQKHGLVALFLSIVFLFLLSDIIEGQSKYFYAFYYLLGVAVIGYGIEFYQKWFTKDRQFDHLDVVAMLLVAYVVSLIYVILTP